MSKIPVELKRFLSKEGRVLLIRGEPGTGKTTLALEIMNDFNFAYLATKKIISEIVEEYRWIKEEQKKKMFSVEEKYDYEESDTFGHVFYLLPESLRYLLNLYERKEIDGIIIDSWHGILEELKIRSMEEKAREMVYESQSFFLKILKLSDMNVKFIVVNEGTEEDPLSYMADGVITMHRNVEDGRVYRWLTLDKLRGEDIKKSTHVFTLSKSHFEFLHSKAVTYPRNIRPFPVKPIPETLFPDVFQFNRGNSIVFDFGNFVPREYKMTTIMTAVANFLKNDSRVVMIPPNELDMSELKYLLYVFSLEKHYKNLVYLYHGDVMESFSRDVDFSNPQSLKIAVDEALADYEGAVPPLVVVGYDRLYNYLQPNEMTQVLYRIKDIVSIHGGILMFAGNLADNGIKRFCSSISDSYVKFTNMSGDVLMYGIKPWTRVYHLSLSSRKGYPTIERREIA